MINGAVHNDLVIVHVIYRLDFGGLENGLVNLINRSPGGFKHIIITLSGKNDEFASRIKKTVDMFDVAKQPGQDWGVYVRLWKLFRKIKPDIVHTRNLATIEAQLPALLAGVKCRVHGEHGWDISDPHGEVVKYQKMRRLLGVFIHRFIPLSRHLESYLLQKVGIKPGKITRICNGVDLSRFTLSKGGAGSEDTITTPIKLICIGRLEQIKGHRFLISALSDIKLSDLSVSNSVHLTLVGDGSCRASLEKQVEDLELKQWITFLGSRSDIPELLAQADCFVLPSEAEGISNTILEAMAAGLPVIATAVGGNADLVINNETGVLVESKNSEALANAILNYAKQPDLLKQHSQAGKSRAMSEFSLERMADKYYEIYSQLGRPLCVE